MTSQHLLKLARSLGVSIGLLIAMGISHAADKVAVGYSIGIASLPYYVAMDQGFFTKEGLEVEGTVLATGVMTQSALVANQIEASTIILAVEAMTANIVKPRSINYISLNNQNANHRVEQWVTRPAFGAKSLADFKGAKLVTSPDLGNVIMAKKSLAAAGLKEGDYTLDQLATDQHINVLVSGRYDGAYTLEPYGTVMQLQGAAALVDSGIIARTILGDRNAKAYMGGAAVSQKFISTRPDVAKRYASAWGKAIAFIRENPDVARNSLLKWTSIPREVAKVMPLVDFTMVTDVDDQGVNNLQSYVDYATSAGILKQKVDVRPFLLKL